VSQLLSNQPTTRRTIGPGQQRTTSWTQTHETQLMSGCDPQNLQHRPKQSNASQLAAEHESASHIRLNSCPACEPQSPQHADKDEMARSQPAAEHESASHIRPNSCPGCDPQNPQHADQDEMARSQPAAEHASNSDASNTFSSTQ
jgi:hypothetical protein